MERRPAAESRLHRLECHPIDAFVPVLTLRVPYRTAGLLVELLVRRPKASLGICFSLGIPTVWYEGGA